MSRSVAVMLAGAAWLGALAGARGGAAAALLVVAVLAGLAAVACTAGWRWGRRSAAAPPRGRRPGWLLACSIVAIMLASAAGAAVRTDSILAGPLAVALAADRGAGVAVEATVRLVTDPRAREPTGWWAIAAVDQVQRRGVRLGAGRERVLVATTDGAPVPVGTTVRLTGLAQPASGPATDWLRARGVVVQIRAIQLQQVAPPGALLASTTWLRERFADVSDRHLPPAQASLLTGLVTGDTRGQPDEVASDVKRSGLSHLVAVSGSNVAAVVAGIMGACLLLGAGRRVGWWLSIGAVWWFVVLVRAEPSVVRAATLGTLVLIGSLIGRARDTVHLLAMAVLLCLLADPLLAGQIGFILSVAATLGVLLITPVVLRLLPGPRLVALLVAATVGAQVAVAPVLAVLGDGVSAAAVPANVVAVPAAAMASALGAAAALLAVWLPELAAWLALLARPPLAVVLWSARTFAGPTGLQIDRWAPRVVALLLVRWLCIWLLATGRAGDRDARQRRWIGARGARGAVALLLVSSMAVLVALGRPAPSAPDAPQLVVLDVGQGDAVLLGMPQAGWMLVDGGPDPEVLRRALGRHGVDHLRMVLLTHPHADHEAGLLGIVDEVPIDQMVVGPEDPAVQHLPRAPPDPGSATDPTRPAVSLSAAGTQQGLPVTAVSAGAMWRFGSAHVRVLSPPQRGIGGDPNESSLVLRIDVPGGRSVLLTGDAEVIAQTRMLGHPDLLDVDVLKVPHHGGATNAPGFLAATTPEVAVISAGRDNPFGHPHPDVLADLEGVEVRRTDVDGDIVVPLR